MKLVTILAALCIYMFGIWSGKHLRAFMADATQQQPSRYTFDINDRLASDESKIAVPCPEQTSKTAVLLLLGQSNAANYAGQRFESLHGNRIVNLYNGRCFIAQSPLLGSSGTRGEYWTQMANLLIDAGHDAVVLIPIAYSGRHIARWAVGGDLNSVLVRDLTDLKYQPTAVIWDQGEIDYVMRTSEADYRQSFLSMVSTIRAMKVDAPIYVTVASKCLEPSNGGNKTHVPINTITRAQVALPDADQKIILGVNTDALLGETDRYDDCHMAGSGVIKVANAWAELLK